MRNVNYKYLLYTVCLFLLTSVARLWSWNTIAELFNWPQTQYKHAIAALVLLLILKWSFYPDHRKFYRVFGENHTLQNH
jgi:hypothetical protein